MDANRKAIVDAKVLLGITTVDQDSILSLYGDMAIQEAVRYTHNEIVEADDVLLTRMIVEKYRTNGNKGLKSQSYSGVSETYIDSTYSNEIMSILQSYRKLQVV